VGKFRRTSLLFCDEVFWRPFKNLVEEEANTSFQLQPSRAV
jgi:hypothetical protein